MEKRWLRDLKIEVLQYTGTKESAAQINKFTKGLAYTSKFGYLLVETNEGISVMRKGEYIYRIIGQKGFWYGSGKFIKQHFKIVK